MAFVDSARIATCVLSAALVGAATAAFPSVGRADDGTGGSPSGIAAATAALDAAIALADGAAALPEDASAALGPDDAATAPATPSGGSGGAADADAGATPTAVAPVAGDGRSRASTGDTAGQNLDTIGKSGDTTPDTGAASDSAWIAAPQPGVSVQLSPRNLNVSVRVASPGDAGPVTQVNEVRIAAAPGDAAAAAGPGAAASVASPVSMSAGSSAAPTGTSGGGAPAGTPSSTAVTPADEPDGVWTWQWNCLSAPAISEISPTGSTAISTPRNWTWIWNCGDNHGQYRGETTAQYQPVNVNVSIRVASPGNDGPVSQSNVAIAVGAVRGGVTVDATGSTPAPPAVTLSPLPALPGLPAVPWVAAAPEPVPPDVAIASPVVEVGSLVDLGLGAVSSPEGLEELLLPIRGAAGWAAPQLGASSVPSLVIARRARTGAWIVPMPGPAVGATPGAQAYPSLATAGRLQPTAPETREASGPSRAERAPRWRVATPASSTPETAPSGTSASAPAGGAASGGGLPLFLALPFLAALLDLARRVALERVTLPSGHRGRVRDTPG